MARLPIVGGDTGNWGTLLNEYIAVSHNSDGTIKETAPLFTQTGNNAVQRTVKDKLQEVVSVKDFGAIGNGTTDDTAAIQAALAAVPTNGGIVLLPRGSYPVSSTLTGVKAGTRIVGDSGGSIILDRLPINSNERLFDVRSSRVTIEGITFDGTGAPAGVLTTRHVMVFFDGGAGRLTDLRVMNCRFVNLTRKGDANAQGDASLQSIYAIYVTLADRIWIERNYMKNISGVGIAASFATDIWVRDNDISMLDSGDALYHLNFDHSIEGGWIVDNRFGPGNRRSGGAINIMSNHLFTNNRRIFVENNLIEGTDGQGSASAVLRYLSVDEGTIRGNIIRNIPSNGRYIVVGSRSGEGVGFQTGGSGIIVENNVLVAGGANQGGIEVSYTHTSIVLGGEDIIIKGNIIRSNGATHFASGIRVIDIVNALVEGNIIEFAFSLGLVDAYGISVATRGNATSLQQTLRPRIVNNFVDALGSTTSHGIFVVGSSGKPVVSPEIRGNMVINTTSAGIRVGGDVSDPTIANNIVVVTSGNVIQTTSLSGTLASYGNREGLADNNFRTTGPLIIGSGGAAIIQHLSATAVLDFDLTSVVSQDLTVTVAGAALGDTVMIGVPNDSVTADTFFFGWVSSADTVTIRATRMAGTPDPASGTFRVDVWKH